MRQVNQGKPLLLVAAAALVRSDWKVLLARRPEGKSLPGLWELPGGKIEPGESPEASLVRELQEELAIEVEPAELEAWSFASHAYDRFHLLMPVFICRRWAGEPSAREGQGLAWASADELSGYPAPEADIPLFGMLADWLQRGQACSG